MSNNNIQLRQYSLGGFNIITLNTSFENIVLKYNSTRIILTCNDVIIMDEPYSKEAMRSAMEYINKSQYREYEDVEEFRQDIEEFKRELDGFMGGFMRGFMQELPTSQKVANTATNDVFEVDSWERLFNDVDVSSTKKSSSYSHQVSQKRNGSCFGGCLGCLVWSVILLAIVALVFYGLGFLGMKIVNFILSLF